MTSMQHSASAFRYAQAALVMILAAALVSACGFRPRGSITLPEDFRQIYVEAPVDITDELAIFLENGGATLSTSRAEADAVFKVQAERYQRRVIAVDAATGKAREFELVYSLDFSVRMKNGIVLVAPERMVLRRILVFDPNAVIGATQNAEALRVDMRRDAAERMIRITEVALGK
jgi:outer membrane lipopolysaccharide assembly protein LptE/RlpB